MTLGRRRLDHSFSGEHDCVGYFFRKRWPQGFICPFCDHRPVDVAPALSVVCPVCRKQTSITARTILHGTRKSLLNWLRLCWLFCASEDGISAREVQQVMALTSYQSSWNWLQKLRQATSIAENRPCRGTVLVDCVTLARSITANNGAVVVWIGIEIDSEKLQVSRFRCKMFSPAGIAQANPSLQARDEDCAGLLSSLVAEDAVIVLPKGAAGKLCDAIVTNPCFTASDEHVKMGRACVAALEKWLLRLYRGAIELRYLQGYIDEFTFRWNRRACQDKMQLFDELVDALVTPQPHQSQRAGQSIRGEEGTS